MVNNASLVTESTYLKIITKSPRAKETGGVYMFSETETNGL